MADPINQVSATASSEATAVLKNISTEINNYASMVQNYKSVTATKLSGCTTYSYTYNNTNYTVIGKIKIQYGSKTLKTNGLSISGYSGTIRWAKDYTSTSSWKTDFSQVDSGDEIYIILKTSDITSTSGSITITFTQNSITYYKSRILVIETYDNQKGQADLTYAASPVTYTGTARLSCNITTPVSVTVEKRDSETNNLIDGIKIRIYKIVSGTKYYLKINTDGTFDSWSTSAQTYITGSSTYRWSQGKITCTNIPLTYGTTLTVYAEEVGVGRQDSVQQSTLADADYYVSAHASDSTEYNTTNGSLSSTKTSDTLTLYDTPLSLTITKTDEDGNAMEGVGFKIQRIWSRGITDYNATDSNGQSDGSDDTWWVVGDVSSSDHKTYTKHIGSATTYYTDEDGSVTITGLGVGLYRIYEVDINGENNDKNDGYYLSNQSGYIETSSDTGYFLDSCSDHTNKRCDTIGYVYCGTVSMYTPGTTSYSKTYTNKAGALEITKYDYATFDSTTKTGTTTLSGVSFALIYTPDGSNYYWVNGDANSSKSYYNISSYDYSKASMYTTGTGGKIQINYLKVGYYFKYETDINWDITEGYYLEDQSASTSVPSGISVPSSSKIPSTWVYKGYNTITSSTTISNPRTTYATNKKSGNLTITKKDADIADTTIEGAQFVLVYKDSSNNYYWVSGDESGKKTYTLVSTSYSEDVATTYTTDSNGQITLNKLRLGTYYIYEIATSGKPYYLADQSDASGRPTITNVSSSWRYCGSKSVSYTHTESSPQTIEITNKRRVKISGYVWVERDSNKNNEYDDDYDNKVDSLLKGVKVYLYKKDGTQVTYTNSSGTTVKYVTTDSSGAYTFGYSWGILYEDLDDYYVKFDYSSLKITDDNGDSRSGTEYIPVAFNNGYATSTKVVKNSSKAMMSSVAEYDTKLTGEATTYTGTSSTYETLYGLSGNLLIKSGTYQLYSTSTNTLANINLGIKPIYEPDYEISETLSYVKLVINDYTYYYEYGDDGSAELSGTNAPTIRYQHPTRTDVYQLSVYPSEVYKMKETSNNSYIEMYVVYAIKVTDTEQEDEKYLYSEQKLYVTSLSNTYDPGRYELCSTVDSDSEYDLETTASSDFTKWTASSSTGSATMTTSSGSTEKVTTQTATYNNTFNMSKSNSVTKYIQFKVQSDAILEMLDYENGIAEDYPTTATSTAYHTYTRYDYSWTNATTSSKGLPYKQTHKTASATRTDSAPYLVLSLGDEKVISGTVFEDEVSSTYSTEDGEVLGNGMYDNGENTVSGVIVELLSAGSDIESSSIAKLYQSGDYSNGTWNYTVCDAITYSASDGTYSFKGVVVGTYYLKFTYPNGDETIVDAEGNKIDTITDAAGNKATTTEITTMINGEEVSLNDYKSTIVTSDTVTEALQAELYTTNSYDEEWYKDYDGESNTTSTCNNYSIAVDDLDTRTSYNNDSTSVTNIFAGSAKLDITIENTESNYTDGDTHVTTYKGFNLGLIKQAVQSVEVEKKITNVKLVNSPTVIFNGNPETDDMTGVTDLDGTTNEGSTYTRVEIEEDSIYGSELTITYTITITNTSDVNYYEIDEEHYGYYYMFGLHDSSYSEQVEINLDEVVDCYDTALEYVEDSNTTGSIAKITLSVTGAWQDENNADCDDEIETCIETQNVLCYGDESTRSEEFEQALVITNLGQIARNADVSIDLDFKKVLSTEDEDMIFVNAAGVSVLTNVVTEETAEKIKQGTIETTSITLIRNPDIPDPSEAELTVIPPTGEDMRTPMIYAIVGIAILVILAAGVIIIRKKVRKLK